MFCVKSDVITLESIEMYGFVTAWTCMDDVPYWVILLMYGSHEMRHTGFPQVDGGQRDPRVGASQQTPLTGSNGTNSHIEVGD